MGMKYLAFSGFVILVGALASGCSGSSDRPPPLAAEQAGGSAGAGGKKGSGGNGGKAGNTGHVGDAGGDAAPPDFGDAGSLGPVVTITSPEAVTDPDVGPVIVNDGATQVEVVCTAVPRDGTGASLVAAGTVTIGMLDASGKTVQVGSVAATKNNNEYSAKFTVGPVPNGKVSFGCSASDKSNHTSTTKITTLIDHGPDIARGKPADKSPHPLGPLDVDFSVTPSPLASGDKGAAVSKVTLAINGVPVDLSKAEDPGKAGHYTPSIALGDQTIFPTKLNGPIAISITATNARGVTQTDTYHFLVDSQGPTIVITAPANDEIIGGKRSLAFTVTDTGAGVNKDSVVVTVNQDTHSYDTKGLWTETNGAYTFSLDSATITGATVQINVNIAASDFAGNASGRTSGTYYLDTRPPIVDLDPPELQEVKVVNGLSICSQPFDPLGKNVANESTIVHSFATIRALAWDQMNGAQEAPLPRFSGVNPSFVQLYVQGDPTAGLLVDTNGDGVCDDIDPALGLPLKDMHPVTPNLGTSSYQSSTSIAGVCASGSDSTPPQALCANTSDLTRVIQHEQRGGTPEPAVYSLLQSGGECDASQLQFSSMRGVTANGWICLAARAVDRAFNVGVSAPMRLCLYAAELGAAPDCAAPMSTPLPTCTTNCTLPVRFFDGGVPHLEHYIKLPE
jgi:hypothetical protein